jgi:hypothetical protein
MNKFNLRDRVTLLIDGKPTKYSGYIVAISTLKNDPDDIVYAVRFNDAEDLDKDEYTRSMACIDVIIISEYEIKYNFTSGKFDDVKCLDDLLNTPVSYWIDPPYLQYESPGQNDADSEDRGGLKYL